MSSVAPDLLIVIDSALRGALVALLALLGWRFGRDQFSSATARVGLALAVGLVVQTYASSPLVEYGPMRIWHVPLIGVSIGNSVLFWLFTRALFEDGFVPNRRHVLIWLVVFVLGLAFCVFAIPPQPPTALKSVLTGLMRWTPALFAVLALVAATAQWSSDLVESRRSLRRFIAVGGILYTLVMVVARVVSDDGRIGGWVAPANVAVLLVLAAVAASLLLRADPGDLLPATGSSAGAPSPVPALTSLENPPALTADAHHEQPLTAAEDRLVERLEHLMIVDRAYRREELTVASLATDLGVPDYRLRRLINQRLGHRNFNAYVNAYRLAEVEAALIDPAKQPLPVLTLALEAGFQSIGPFNRAFKAATGMTPTEFRRQKLTDS